MHVALAHPDPHVRAPGDALDVRAEELVGRNSTSRSAGIDSTTSTALDDVQQMSVSAFTSAEVLT